MTQPHDLTALEAAAEIRRGNLSPVELVEHALDRAERLGPRLGAFARLTPEIALAEARAAESRLVATHRRDDLPPLFGLPTAIKDLQSTAGTVTSFGSAAYAGFVPPVDDAIVSTLRAAGLISIGKTSTPEFGLPCYTEPTTGPPAATPWDESRSAGGSSGGAAAAVAGGLIPIAQGGDGGGSIRIPASVCGLVGLKPSRGRVSDAPGGNDLASLGVLGPLARTVRDAAVFLDLVAGRLAGDPDVLPTPPSSFLAACELPHRRRRVARWATPMSGTPVDPEVSRVFEATSALLLELGHEVVDIDIPGGADVVTAFTTVWAAIAASIHVPPGADALLTALTRHLRGAGLAATGPEVAGALMTLRAAARAVLAATELFDAVLMPTVAREAQPHGWFSRAGDPALDLERQVAFTPFTQLANVTGQPAVSLPAGWSPDGLPIGMMLVGRPAGEHDLLALAAEVEAALPTVGRPPIWAD